MSQSDKQLQHRFATSGDHPVQLTVKDRWGRADTITKTVRVVVEALPVADFHWTGSRIEGEPLTLVSDAVAHSNLVLTYHWNIAGTVVSSSNPSHTFTPPIYGDYPISHWVVDQWDRASSVVQGVVPVMSAELPSVVFTAAESSQDPLLWLFTVTSKMGVGTALHWDYGDGAQETSSANASHLYQAGGAYTVSCVAVDRWGRTSAAATQQIQVRAMPAAPTASISYTPSAPKAGEAVTFTANHNVAPSDLQTIAWDLGDDGSVEHTTATFQHTYTAAGTATVRLTVMDTWGRSATTTATLNVTEDAPHLWQELEASSPGLVAAVWDRRFGVITSGGLVDEWQDARGPGYNWKLAATGTQRPALSDGRVLFDGVDDHMSVSSANLENAFTGSEVYACIVARFDRNPTGTTDAETLLRLSDVNSHTALEVRRYLFGSQTTEVRALPGGSGTSVSGTITNRTAAGSIHKVVHLFTSAASGWRIGMRVASGIDSFWREVTGSGTFRRPRNVAMGTRYQGAVSQVLLLTRRPTASEITKIEQHAVTHHGANTTWT